MTTEDDLWCSYLASLDVDLVARRVRLVAHVTDGAATRRLVLDLEGVSELLIERPSEDREQAEITEVHVRGIIACQVILKGYWQGYIQGDEPALARSVEIAYPQPVERIRRQTRAPTTASAAAKLLEQLIHPGFDPAQGAEATRRYVRRKASIVVMEHRKQEDPGRCAWRKVGVSERRFYKLLPLFANKVNGRYDYDHDDVVARMRAHLDALDGDRAIRAAALEILRSRGFREEAARKWLQRHRPEEVHAWPRGLRPIDKPQPNAGRRHPI